MERRWTHWLAEAGQHAEAALSRLFKRLSRLFKRRGGDRPAIPAAWRGRAGAVAAALGRWPIVFLLVVVTGAVRSMLLRVDSALQQMHVESGTSGSARAFAVSFGDLGGSLATGPARDTAAATTGSWRDYDAAVAGRTVLAEARDVAREVVLLDAGYALLVTLLVGAVIAALRRANPAVPGRRQRYRRMLFWSAAALLLHLGLELAEDAQVWLHLVQGHPLLAAGPIALGPLTTLLRQLLAFAVAVPILIVATAGLADNQALRRTLWTTRAAGLAVVVLGVLLFVGIGAAQVDDVVRAWTPSTAVFGLLAAAGLAVIVTGVTRDLSGPRAEGLEPEAGAPSQPLLLAGGVLLLIVGQVLRLVGLGWGLSVAGGLLLGIWLLGVLLEGWTTRDAPGAEAGAPPAADRDADAEVQAAEAQASEVRAGEVRAAEVRRHGDRLGRGLGGLVLALFVWVIARAIALDLFARQPVPMRVVGLPAAAAVVAVVFGAVLVARGRRDPGPDAAPATSWPLRRRAWFWVTVLAGAGFALLWVDRFAVRGAEAAGTVAVLLAGFGLVVGATALAAGTVRTRARHYALPPALRVLRLRRFPVVVFLVAWVLVVSTMDQGGFHDIRRQAAGPAAGAPPTLGAAWNRWATAAAPSGSGVHPVVLVAAQGGGIRAAVWTALVLECLFGPGPVQDSDPVCAHRGSAEPDRMAIAVGSPTPVFIASGASGGSLGIAAWSARRADLVQDGAAARTPRTIEAALSRDFVAPDAARLFTTDLPHTLLVWDRADRAEMLERSWQGAWPADGPAARGLNRGLRTLWTVTHDGAAWATPIVALNGVSVEDGCRFVASAVDFTLPRQVPDDLGTLALFPTAADDRPDDAACRGPQDGEAAGVDALPSTSELIDYLCADEDVPLATAAHLSARFPYISPTGRVTSAGCGDGWVRDSAVSFDADGGIFDNSGAGTVADSWRALGPFVAAQERQQGTCFPPVFIQIDNSPPASTVSSGADPRPAELLAPLGVTLGQVGSRESYARARAAATFARPVSPSGLTVQRADGRPLRLWFRISLFGQPGPQPPLGWTLAPQTVSDMRAQLQLPQNAAQLQQIRDLLTGAALTCS